MYVCCKLWKTSGLEILAVWKLLILEKFKVSTFVCFHILWKMRLSKLYKSLFDISGILAACG